MKKKDETVWHINLYSNLVPHSCFVNITRCGQITVTISLSLPRQPSDKCFSLEREIGYDNWGGQTMGTWNINQATVTEMEILDGHSGR